MAFALDIVLLKDVIYIQSPSLTRTSTDVLDSIEEYVNSHPDVLADTERWIEGFGWDQTRWENWKGGFPSKVAMVSIFSSAA